MLKKNIKAYLLLFFCLLIIIAFPRRAQNALRHQFIKPLIPVSNLAYSRKAHQLPKTCYTPNQKPKIELSYPSSHLAKIIFRNPGNWNHFLWIDMGHANNSEEVKISVNSPVLFENNLIGVIDYVGKKQSRVKLITNANLTVSVRALRGKKQYEPLLAHLRSLSSYQCVQNNDILLGEIEYLKSQILSLKESAYYAKGELSGLSQPLWRANSKILLGKGFNCNFSDEHSIARELHSEPMLAKEGFYSQIIQKDDLLVTTGLDGVLPEGLLVAKVLQVDPLEEGGYCYSLKAAPVFNHFDDLSYVEVILPLNYQHEEPTAQYH